MTLSAYKFWQLIKPRRKYRVIARELFVAIGQAHHRAGWPS